MRLNYELLQSQRHSDLEILGRIRDAFRYVTAHLVRSVPLDPLHVLHVLICEDVEDALFDCGRRHVDMTQDTTTTELQDTGH